MATNLNANLSTEQLRKSLGKESDSGSEAEATDQQPEGNGYLKPVRPARSEETPAPMDSSSGRFQQVDWDGGGGREALQQTAEESRSDGARPAGKLATDQRFQAVPWDPSEAQRRRQQDYEEQQEEAKRKSEKMKLGNFFDRANL